MNRAPLSRARHRLATPWATLVENGIEILVAAGAIAAGAVQLLTGIVAPSIATTLDPFAQRLWFLYLVVGGLLTILGVFARSPENLLAGIRQEAVGLTILGTGLLVYGIAILAQGIPELLAGGLFFTSVGLGMFFRLVWLRRFVRTVEEVSR